MRWPLLAILAALANAGGALMREVATVSNFASDDMPLVLGIAIGVPLGAAYLAVHNGVLAV